MLKYSFPGGIGTGLQAVKVKTVGIVDFSDFNLCAWEVRQGSQPTY